MQKYTLEQRINRENNRLKVSEAKILNGSIVGKFPVILDEGKTVIYISDKSKEAETRDRHELRKSELHKYLR